MTHWLSCLLFFEFLVPLMLTSDLPPTILTGLQSLTSLFVAALLLVFAVLSVSRTASLVAGKSSRLVGWER